LIQARRSFFVSSISIAGIAQINRQQDRKLISVCPYDVVQQLTILPLTFEIARFAGELRNTGIVGGITDTLILATARLNPATIVTGDQHFRGLDGVLYPGK